MTMTGRIKFWTGEKGFGFIERDDGDEDVFIHASVVQRAGIANLYKDDRVSFDVEPGKPVPPQSRICGKDGAMLIENLNR